MLFRHFRSFTLVAALALFAPATFAEIELDPSEHYIEAEMTSRLNLDGSRNLGYGTTRLAFHFPEAAAEKLLSFRAHVYKLNEETGEYEPIRQVKNLQSQDISESQYFHPNGQEVMYFSSSTNSSDPHEEIITFSDMGISGYFSFMGPENVNVRVGSKLALDVEVQYEDANGNHQSVRSDKTEFSPYDIKGSSNSGTDPSVRPLFDPVSGIYSDNIAVNEQYFFSKLSKGEVGRNPINPLRLNKLHNLATRLRAGLTKTGINGIEITEKPIIVESSRFTDLPNLVIRAGKSYVPGFNSLGLPEDPASGINILYVHSPLDIILPYNEGEKPKLKSAVGLAYSLGTNKRRIVKYVFSKPIEVDFVDGASHDPSRRQQLQAAGARVLNAAEVAALTNHKWGEANVYLSQGVPYPNTTKINSSFTEDQTLAVIRKVTGRWGFVVKPVIESDEFGAMHFNPRQTDEGANYALEVLKSAKKEAIIQTYIPSKKWEKDGQHLDWSLRVLAAYAGNAEEVTLKLEDIEVFYKANGQASEGVSAMSLLEFLKAHDVVSDSQKLLNDIEDMVLKGMKALKEVMGVYPAYVDWDIVVDENEKAWVVESNILRPENSCDALFVNEYRQIMSRLQPSITKRN